MCLDFSIFDGLSETYIISGFHISSKEYLLTLSFTFSNTISRQVGGPENCVRNIIFLVPLLDLGLTCQNEFPQFIKNVANIGLLLLTRLFEVRLVYSSVLLRAIYWYNYWWPIGRDGRFGSKVGQIGLKWDKSGTFSDQISVHLAQKSQMYWNLIWKVPDLSNLRPIWPTLEPNLSSLHCSANEIFSQTKSLMWEKEHKFWWCHQVQELYIYITIVCVEVETFDQSVWSLKRVRDLRHLHADIKCIQIYLWWILLTLSLCDVTLWRHH